MGELLKEMGQRMLARRKQLRLTQETLAITSCFAQNIQRLFPLRLHPHWG